MRWAVAHIQEPDGSAVYLRLATRPVPQLPRTLDAAATEALLDGAYWLRRPGPNAEIVVAYAGAVAPEALEAVGLLAEDRRAVGLLAVTSADRLYRGWTDAQAAREDGTPGTWSHVERLLAPVPRQCGLVTVLDGHPASLGWLGSVGGHRTRALGVTRFGQTGTVADLYRAAGIDTQAIMAAAQAVAPGRPVRYLRAG